MNSNTFLTLVNLLTVADRLQGGSHGPCPLVFLSYLIPLLRVCSRSVIASNLEYAKVIAYSTYDYIILYKPLFYQTGARDAPCTLDEVNRQVGEANMA